MKGNDGGGKEQRLLTEFTRYAAEKAHQPSVDPESIKQLAEELLAEIKRWHSNADGA